MIAVADLRPITLFDGLTDAQLVQLIGAGTEVIVQPGTELFHEGDPAAFWYVLIDGVGELIRHVGREDVRVGALDMPGRWSAGFRAWDEHGVYLASGVGAAPSRLLQVPAPALRALLTEWFPLGVHLLAGLSGTARAVEATARQRQSLVRLGTLAAGLAHELNNPAAAAIRNVAALKNSIDSVLASLASLSSQQITADQFAALDAMRAEGGLGAGPQSVDPLDLADRAEEIESWLDERSVASPWEVAAQLAAAGVDIDLCTRVQAVVPGRALRAALTWIAGTATTTSLLGQLTESTRRISDLVAATRSYTQMDRGSAQTIDVTEGIESTVAMLSGKLGGVTVERSYDPDLPRVDAYPGELNQVWTNLIDNAVDAMSGVGTLRLVARSGQDGGVVVEIGDSGSGMPPEVATRAFEAFYTTKDVGAGTGLGLDIAQRNVVERHGGAIEIDSRPGDTVMRVRLPRQAHEH
jgi:signal transduction histidine kinase